MQRSGREIEYGKGQKMTQVVYGQWYAVLFKKEYCKCKKLINSQLLFALLYLVVGGSTHGTVNLRKSGEGKGRKRKENTLCEHFAFIVGFEPNPCGLTAWILP